MELLQHQNVSSVWEISTADVAALEWSRMGDLPNCMFERPEGGMFHMADGWSEDWPAGADSLKELFEHAAYKGYDYIIIDRDNPAQTVLGHMNSDL